LNSSKRDQVVAAAHRLFLEHGYGATSMDSIAIAANVSKRTVYSHFETKEALFRGIIKAFCNRMNGAVAGDYGDMPAADRLRRMGRDLVELILHTEARATLRIVVGEAEQFPELARAFWEAGPLQHLDRLAAQLADDFDLDTDDARLAARQFAGMLKGPYFLPCLLGTEPAPTAAEIENHVAIAVARFLHGIGPQQAECGGANRRLR